MFPSPNTVIHWYVPEEDTREKEEEIEEEKFHLEE